MTVSAATLRMMAGMGLTIEQAAALAEQIESDNGPSKSSGAERQRRYRERKSGKAQGVTDSVTSDVTGDVTPKGDGSPKEYIQTPSLPKSPSEASPPSVTRARKPATTFVVPSDIPEAEWEAFDEMRRKGKASKAWTDKARQLAVNELRRLAEAGHPPGEVLNQSTLNGWTGVYPLKDRNNAGNRQGGTNGRWQRPALVSDLVAARRERLAVVG